MGEINKNLVNEIKSKNLPNLIYNLKISKCLRQVLTISVGSSKMSKVWSYYVETIQIVSISFCIISKNKMFFVLYYLANPLLMKSFRMKILFNWGFQVFSIYKTQRVQKWIPCFLQVIKNVCDLTLSWSSGEHLFSSSILTIIIETLTSISLIVEQRNKSKSFVVLEDHKRIWFQFALKGCNLTFESPV